MLNIKVVFNNCNWTSIDSKLTELGGWFSSFSPKIDYVKTSFNDIPFSSYSSTDNTMLGVDKNWYDEHISPLGIGYQIVILVLERKQWKEPNGSRGWRNDDTVGAIELQIACDEFETNSGWPNFPATMNNFFLLSRHEVLHALYMISGQPDRTHYWWNQGKLESARDEIRLPNDYQIPGLMKAVNYLKGILFKLIGLGK